MRYLWNQAVDFIGDLWMIGTFFARVAVLFFVFWPIVIAVVAGSGAPWIVVFGFGLFGPLTAAAIVFAFPLVVGIASLTRVGAAAIGGAAILIAAELLWTAYCIVVPVENSPQMLACVMLAGVVIFLASMSATLFAVSVRIGANLAIAAMTVLFYFARPAYESPTHSEPGSMKYAIDRVKNTFEAYAEERRRDSLPKDRIDILADTFDYPVPFEPGVPTKVIRVNSFERTGSGWDVFYDVEVTAPCKVVFLEGREVFQLEPGKKLPDGIFTGTFRIVGGTTPGVAKVSVWRAPAATE